MKTYHFQFRRTHGGPYEHMSVVAESGGEALTKLPVCVTWDFCVAPPEKPLIFSQTITGAGLQDVYEPLGRREYDHSGTHLLPLADQLRKDGVDAIFNVVDKHIAPGCVGEHWRLIGDAYRMAATAAASAPDRFKAFVAAAAAIVRDLAGTYGQDRIPECLAGGHDQWNQFCDEALALDAAFNPPPQPAT